MPGLLNLHLQTRGFIIIVIVILIIMMIMIMIMIMLGDSLNPWHWAVVPGLVNVHVQILIIIVILLDGSANLIWKEF